MEVDYGYVIMKMVMSIGIVVVVGSVASVYKALVMKPKKERWSLEKQGINGPPPMILLGNLLHMKKAVDSHAAYISTIHHPPSSITHNCASSIFPFLDQWIKKYGTVFAFSLGVKTAIHVSEPALLKEIATTTSWDLGRPSFAGKEQGPLLGQGIIASNGADWASQRKIIAPHLYLDKVKGMTKMITDSSVAILESIMNKMKVEGRASVDIDIVPWMQTFSGDVISKACFGSSYSHSEDIFLKIRRLEEVSSNMLVVFGIPGLRYIPTKKNMEAWALEKEVHKLIMKIVNGRKQVGGCNETKKDLLQMLLENAKSNGLKEDARDKFIVDNCKNMYLAGNGSTAVTSSWCLMLLALNPEWQARVRNEVLQVCKGAQVPTYDMLLQMKQLTMVIYETLRLYPSGGPVMVREALNDMKIGEIHVEKGMQIWSYVLTLHTDPEIWGPDSLEFNPQRFSNGVTGSCEFPHMYMPFGIGPRICLGQHLAMTEIKAIISLIVANLSFSISPHYVHSPVFKHGILPKSGINLLLNKLL